MPKSFYLTSLISFTALLGLPACQPASDTAPLAERPQAETVAATTQAPSPEDENSNASEHVTVSTPDESTSDHPSPAPDATHYDHKEHEAHAAHTGDEDHADHDASMEPAAHDDHEMAGGEAHLHGHAELALTQDGDMVTVSLISPLANFGLSETQPDIEDASVYGDAVITLRGGECSETGRTVDIETSGQHGQMHIDLMFRCQAVEALTGATTQLFSQYPGFDAIDLVMLTESHQAASVLTETANQIIFP